MMGTRCTTTVWGGQDTPLITFYRQFDGYPSGHGQELADFLNGYEIVNGIVVSREPRPMKQANGMSCLAAQIITHFKSNVENYDFVKTEDGAERSLREGDHIGNIYIQSHDTAGSEAFHYDVKYNRDNEQLLIVVDNQSEWTVEEFDGDYIQQQMGWS